MTKAFASVFAAALLFGSSVHAQSLQPIDRIAAVVNEDVILQSELDRAVGNIRAQYAQQPDQLPPPDVLRRQVLERLVLVRLQVAQAEQTGIRISDQELDGAVNAVAQQNQMTLQQLQQQLVRDGMSFNDFRESLRDEIAAQRLRQRFAQTRISVTESEVDNALASQAAGGTQYRLAHILVALPEGATAEQIATGEQKIEGVKGLIDRGEMDFAAAAVRYSDSPNALEGGDLGWRSLDEIPAAFASQIRTMQAGQMLGPTRGPSGFQLLKLVELRDAAESASAPVTQYKARHILLRAEAGDDATARAQIESLRGRIAGGADFATLAREHSQDQSSADNGGDLGWFVRDQFGANFGAQVAALEDGAVSMPFRTETGWHIVQREATRQTTAGDDMRRAQVREMIGQRKLEDEWNRYLRELRGEAYVDVRGED
ncbi:MAG: peptidylprolyl isomerase [Pseudoxanthomonas suwonensis]|nr:peptidylprolyl isomerase [Pseudoxanthomonas suwonensis]